jgi:hypothetical protein
VKGFVIIYEIGDRQRARLCVPGRLEADAQNAQRNAGDNCCHLDIYHRTPLCAFHSLV